MDGPNNPSLRQLLKEATAWMLARPNSARWAARCHLARITGLDAHLYGGPVGPPATIVCKPRQVRKEATVANDSGAGVWLAGPPPFAGAERFA
jgi:hypothetical protein